MLLLPQRAIWHAVKVLGPGHRAAGRCIGRNARLDWQRHGAQLRAFSMARWISSTPSRVQEEKRSHQLDVARTTPPFFSPHNLRLRPYQVDCITAIIDTLKQGQYSRLGVSSPTGSGKTSMFTSLIKLLPPLLHSDDESANQVLILVGSVVLAQQAADSVKRAWPGTSVEVEQGNKRASGLADVTVATFQTLARGEYLRLTKFDPSRFKAVIIDEAHHAVAPSYLRILSHFDPRISQQPIPTSPLFIAPDVPQSHLALDDIEPVQVLPSDEEEAAKVELAPLPAIEVRLDPLTGRPCVPLIGFTATFSRADDLALGAVFERIVWHAEWLDMIRGKWLSPLRFTTLDFRSILDLASVRTTASGDFSTPSLAGAFESSNINNQIVHDWQKRAGSSRSTLVFAVNIDHVVALANAFRTELGVEAAFVHEGIRQADREIIYERFRAGEIRVLVNCGILTEGADFPAIDCVLLCRPTRSRNLFLQMIGRGLRLSPETGKKDCLIIDLVGNHTQGLVCAPTLFGLDPAEQKIENRTTEDLEQMGEKQATLDQQHDTQVSLRYRDYSSIFDLVQDRKNKPLPVRSISNLAWVGTGEGLILELPGKGYIRVSKDVQDSAGGRVNAADFYRRLPRQVRASSPYARPDRVHVHECLEKLISHVDRLVLSDPRMKPDVGIRHSAGWRFGRSTASQQARILKTLSPPREDDGFEQRQTIDAIWIPRGVPGERIPVSELTAGQASDLICRLAHGGLGNMRKMVKEADKQWQRAGQDRHDRSKARVRLGIMPTTSRKSS